MEQPKIYKSFAKNFRLVCEPSAPYFNKVKIQTSTDIANFIRGLYDIDQTIEIVESFYILLTNQACTVTGWVKLSQGGLTGTVADPQLIAKYAIEQLAKGVVIAHNHPSGTLRPSQADITLTEKVKAGLGLFGIRLLDHVILTEDSYYSFADEGEL